jgi:hypothetical protein
MNIITWITENWTTILAALGGVYGVATVIATLTPTGKDDSFLAKVGAIADRIGLQLKDK